jgi:hypothetical protein
VSEDSFDAASSHLHDLKAPTAMGELLPALRHMIEIRKQETRNGDEVIRGLLLKPEEIFDVAASKTSVPSSRRMILRSGL